MDYQLSDRNKLVSCKVTEHVNGGKVSDKNSQLIITVNSMRVTTAGNDASVYTGSTIVRNFPSWVQHFELC